MGLLFRAGRACGGGRALGEEDCRVDNLLSAVVLVCAIWVPSAACQASVRQAPSAAQLLTASSFCDQGCAVADFDGDGLPDLAIARAEGWSPSGYRYRIDLDLSTRAGLSSFTVSAQRGGLRITPRDVNGDWDLDLVITTAWSFTPVGVWINDGHGGFARGDLTTDSLSIWTKTTRIVSGTPRETLQAILPEFSRDCADSAGGPTSCKPFIDERLTFLLAAVHPAGDAVRRPQTRGPPVLSGQPRKSRRVEKSKSREDIVDRHFDFSTRRKNSNS